MERLFLAVLRMSLAGAVVILAVLPLRLLLRRAPGKYSYLLWSAAGFRLCVPGLLRTPLSLFRLLSRPAASVRLQPGPLGLDLPWDTAAAVPASAFTDVQETASLQTAETAAEYPWLCTLTWVWLGGLAALLLYSLVAQLLLRRKLSTAVRLEGPVYRASGIGSPFLLGLFRPRIYIPWDLADGDLEYTLAHEYCHLRRGDQIWRLLGWLLLCVHWFDPLVWLAFLFMSRDMERSCDEAVLERMGDVRRKYSESLLHIAGKRRLPAPVPPAFGETDVGSRIRNILRWKKAKGWVSVCALLLCLAFIASCATDAARSAFDRDVTVNPDGSLGSLRWGMSPEEALTADSRFVMTGSPNSYYEFAELKGASVLGYTADIRLTFSKRTLEDGIRRSPEGRPILDDIHILIPGEVSVTEALTQVFGEPEKRLASDNEWDMADGLPTIRWRPNELPEEKWYWHTAPVVYDIPIEQLRLSIPALDDMDLLGAWCSIFGCKVILETFETEDGMAADVSFIGYGSALQRYLAEEYAHMTEEG